MRLTNVSQMQTQAGRLSSYAVAVQPLSPEASGGAASAQLPVSFDQSRHVSFGSRPGSWMGVSFQLPAHASLEQIEQAWLAVVARHGTLQSVFEWAPAARASTPEPLRAAAEAEGPARSGGPDTDLTLQRVQVLPGAWERLRSPAARVPASGFTAPTPAPPRDSEVLSAPEVRAALRAHFDTVCDPFGAPSYRLCVIEDVPGTEPGRGSLRTPQIIIGSDHSHVDAWSLLVLVRDLNACLADVLSGQPVGAQLPEAEPFADHSALFENKPFPPEEVVTRWREILEAGGGAMPSFPLALGDITAPADEVVEVRDVFDAEELAFVEDHARQRGVRLIALAVSVMTRLARELSGQPLRAVFPVHSREDPRWFNSVGWFITNSVLENDDDDIRASYAAVKEAIRLGSYPLAPIMRPYGGMPQDPGMFAMSWLDHRKLPVNVSEELNPQHISAVIRTNGVMIWFVINDSGLHLRCRYPDTRQARRAMRTWLAGLVYGLRAPLEQSPGAPS